ncbi:uncharacterized protein [Venturia canescens]|nr:uncharacterized protein LOC122418079 isoform X2 [Venturia canescens]
MTRILTFPLMKKDQNGNSASGFAPGNPAGECLEGGVDAGVINGAVKIGIGFGLAAGCKDTLQKYEGKFGGTESPPKMVRIPIFIPRPVPVPVPVPQPYPIAVDRPVGIPQPIPFPSFNMPSHHPVMRPMLQFPGRFMTGKSWLFWKGK